MNRQMSEIVRRQNPTTLRPCDTVQEACQQMQARRIGAVVITDEQERLLGIFTGRDAVRVLAEAKASGSDHVRERDDPEPRYARAWSDRDRSAATDAGWRFPARARCLRVGQAGRRGIAIRFPGPGAGSAGRGTGYWERI